MAKRRKHAASPAAPPAPRTTPLAEPRTGVGTPDARAEPAGISLGGDAGDVNIPRISGVPAGETGGATDDTEWSTVWRNPDAPEESRRAG